MEKNRLLFAIMAMMLILALAACVRPASTPPPSEASPTTAGEFPVPGATDDVMSQLEQAATQTLMAMQGTPISSPTVPPVQGTAVPVQPTSAAPVDTAVVQPTQEAAAVVAPTATPVPLPQPTPGRPSSWTLQKGEFPFCLARRFDVSPEELLRLNGLSSNSYFYAGMVFKIPQTGNGFPGGRSLKSHPTNYTVVSGDTIFTIACQFGDVDPYAIAAANGLASPYNLKSGQNLYIP
jgi:LysM repeat protein